MRFTNPDITAFMGHHFDFRNQHKSTYEDWLKAFSAAVARRAVDGCFLGMSSGYDSGALTRELTNQGVAFRAYTVYYNEHAGIIDQRRKYLRDCVVATMTIPQWKQYRDFLRGKINDVAMRDTASMGVAYMFDTATKEGRKVCISGQAGDEILSDYALYPAQSHFKGNWPEDLYEWPNFRGHMNLEYLKEIEEIAALYGVEVRYPFLDVDLVQEFLWLTAELKNRNYKAPLYEYLTRNNVPFERAVKRGFNPVSKTEAAAA